MNRVSKLFVFVANVGAIVLLSWFVSSGIPRTLVPTLAAFVLGIGAALALGDLGLGLILGLLYAAPAVLHLWLGTYNFSYCSIWLAALCGAMAPKSLRTGWAYPRLIAAPLMFWCFVLTVSVPLIILREVDFVPHLIYVGRLWTSRLGVFPGVVAVWILSVGAIATTGLLLLDWLFATKSDDQQRRRLLAPMFAGACVAAAVASYQATADMTFLNETLFGSLGRAVGTMRDANAFGAIAAMWLPVACAMAVTARSKGLNALLSAAALLFAIGVWASGSRTALLAASIGMAVLLAAIARSLRPRTRLVAAIVIVAAVAAAARWLPGVTTGPLARLTNFVTTPQHVPLTPAGARFVIEQLWSRGLYGTAADRMIREHPWVGIGLGNFNFQLADYLYLIDGSTLPPDNAQNWYRHQLAEIGILGSLGWIAWITVLAWIITTKRSSTAGATFAAVKGALLGLGAASLVGMPTQDVAAAMTFVVLAFVLLSAIDAHALDVSQPRARLAGYAFLAAFVLFVGSTAYDARHDLRPPERAVRADFPYSYGFLESSSPTENFRWTEARAVSVFHADARWLKFTIGDVAPDASVRPVRVEIAYNGQSVLRVDRRSNFPITKYIKLPKAGTPLLMEIHVNRTWRPADVGLGTDTRPHGVEISNWEFMWEDPPKGSLTVE